MSFFEEAQPSRESSDPRVNAWKKQRVHTFEDTSFQHKIREAHDAVFNVSTVGSRTSKPSLPFSVDKTPSISYASKVAQSVQNGPRPNGQDEAEASSNAVGQRSNSPWTGKAPTGPTNFTKNAPPGLRTEKTSPSIKTVEQLPHPRVFENKLPPHLRRPSEDIVEESTPANKSSKRGTRAAPAMNAGTAAKLAKLASKFPCTYIDCTLGFENEKAMKKHKEKEHHYCRLCDEDCNDFDELLNHKLYNEEHICCCVCGQDFHSESGRDRHERQVIKSVCPLSIHS